MLIQHHTSRITLSMTPLPEFHTKSNVCIKTNVTTFMGSWYTYGKLLHLEKCMAPVFVTTHPQCANGKSQTKIPARIEVFENYDQNRYFFENFDQNWDFSTNLIKIEVLKDFDQFQDFSKICSTIEIFRKFLPKKFDIFRKFRPKSRFYRKFWPKSGFNNNFHPNRHFSKK